MNRQMMHKLAIVAISIGTGAGLAQPSAQPAFPSAADAGQSLFQAVQDNNEAAIHKILGGSTDLTSSHDDSQDKADREVFVQKYQEMHRLHRERDGSARTSSLHFRFATNLPPKGAIAQTPRIPWLCMVTTSACCRRRRPTLLSDSPWSLTRRNLR